MESLLIQLTILAKDTTFVPMEIRQSTIVDLERFLTQISKSVIMKAITNVEMELQSIRPHLKHQQGI